MWEEILGGASLLSNLFGGNKAAKAATQAAQLQQQGIQKATDIQKPILDAGMPALNTLSQGFAPGGEFTKQFTMADAVNSPAEQHALEQGTQAIQNSAAARGGLLGTNTLQGLTEFGQSNAAQYENQAFNQWLAERNQQVGGLQSLANTGVSAADNVSNLALGSGNVAAAGKVGATNAQTGGISDIVNQFSMLSGLFKPQTTGSAGVPVGGYNPALTSSIGAGAFVPTPSYSIGGP